MKAAQALAIAPVTARRTLREEVLEQLTSAIVTGQLSPGTLVTVPTLLEQFDCSATPVREALLELEQQGFVEAVRNKGYRVTEVSRQDLVEIVQVRQWLEVPAIRKAAAVFPINRADHFATLATAIVGYAAQGDLAKYLTADWAFHRELLQLVDNDRLVGIVGRLRRQTRMVGLSNIVGTDLLRHSAEEHQRMVELLIAGDGNAAAVLLNDHIGHVLGWWSGELEQVQ